MAATQEIKTVVRILRGGIKTGLIVKLKVTIGAVEQFVKTLEEKDYIKIQNINKRDYTVQIKSLTNISVVKNETVKAKNIHKYTRKVLPSITGTVILSTPKGIMAHDEAFDNKLGGRVIVIVY